MSREQVHFTQHQRYMPSSQHHGQNYNQYGLHVNPSQPRQPNQSELVIFNGQAQDRDLFQSTQRIHNQTQSQTQTQYPPRMGSSGSQNRLDVVYKVSNQAAYNSNQGSRHVVGTKEGAQYAREGAQYGREGAQYAKQPEERGDGNHSEVFQYGQMFPQPDIEHQLDSNGFQTFKQLPVENIPQTAHFLPADENRDREETRFRGNSGFGEPRSGSSAYQNTQYLPIPEDRHTLPQPVQRSQSNSRPLSKIRSPIGAPALVQPLRSGQPVPPAPLSPRINFQNTRSVASPASSGHLKMVQIPELEYQQFIEHLPRCKQSQDEMSLLKVKNDELAHKQHFYWQQNTTLREENKRLRDLVNHFEKRDKELTQSRSDFKQSYESLIQQHRNSSLQQMGLLFQRYRLELQKGK